MKIIPVFLVKITLVVMREVEASPALVVVTAVVAQSDI